MSGFGYVPESIANQALISLGHPRVLGSLRDGSKEANAILEVYAPSVEEITRAAHWAFARRQGPLNLLNYQNGTAPPLAGSGTPGMGQWLYEYAYPLDCMKARYVPWQNGVAAPVPPGNIVPPDSGAPLTTASPFFFTARTVPAPFLVSQDIVPTVIGLPATWQGYPDFDSAQGQAPQQQTVILTNVPNASLVYTSVVKSPNVWDPLFRQAVISLIAAKIALVVMEDKNFALKMQGLVIAKAKTALEQARIADGNEGPSSIRWEASWVRTRSSGGYGDHDGRGYDGPGVLGYGWDACPFPNGDVF